MNNIIFPDYENSILNLINSILKYYHVETKYKGLDILDKILQRKYKNIVLIVLDGMGEHIINHISPNGFFKKHQIRKITSVFPSTTTAAMTTYYSGKPPIETGWIAWSQYFKEYGRSIDVLPNRDSYTGEVYKDAKINVQELIQYISIYDQIEENSKEVKAYEISPSHCMSRSKRNINANTMGILCDSIEAICKNTDENFILAYNDEPDGLLHKYDCESSEVKEFILETEKKIENLYNKLQGTNTLLIISADHGHKDIERVYDIQNMEDIQECLIMPPSLESRCTAFWVKEEKKKEFEKIFKKRFEKEFLLFTKDEFLEKHMLGFGNKHKKIDDFIGNYISVSIGNASFKLGTNISKEKPEKKSTHCGLSPEEMEVPLIIL